VAANPLLVVATAANPSEASRRADPASKAFGWSSGSPFRCSARKAEARSGEEVMPGR
jgi:hypothetical protein